MVHTFHFILSIWWLYTAKLFGPLLASIMRLVSLWSFKSSFPESNSLKTNKEGTFSIIWVSTASLLNGNNQGSMDTIPMVDYIIVNLISSYLTVPFEWQWFHQTSDPKSLYNPLAQMRLVQRSSFYYDVLTSENLALIEI